MSSGTSARGYFEMQRTGDDVSGKVWERTRRMGVNTLGFRLPQNRAFFTNDADCVAITPAIPWTMTRQWLEAVTQSGTLLLVSPDPASMGAAQKQAVRAAFADSRRRRRRTRCPLTGWRPTRRPVGTVAQARPATSGCSAQALIRSLCSLPHVAAPSLFMS